MSVTKQNFMTSLGSRWVRFDGAYLFALLALVFYWELKFIPLKLVDDEFYYADPGILSG